MAVNKVVYGDRVLIDTSTVTVTADKLAAGYTALDASGTLITGIAEVDGVQGKKYTKTLTVAGWSNNSQTVTCAGVTSDSVILCGPDSTSMTAFTAAKVMMTGQGTNTVTFSCSTTPTAAITINIVALSGVADE